MTTKETMQRLKHDLSPYDPLDLVATIAALQLIPENAGRSARLEAAAHVCASMPPSSEKPRISRNRLREILNSEWLLNSTIVSNEDPPAGCLIQAITTHNGTYHVVTYAVEEEAFVLQNLLKAIFLYDETFSNLTYPKATHQSVTSLLAISERIIQTAQLTRQSRPGEFGRNVTIPSSSELGNLKNAVTFTEEDIGLICDSMSGKPGDLSPFCCELGEQMNAEFDIDNGRLFRSPIIIHDGRYIVALPILLATAARHHIICLAQDHNVSNELAKRFHYSVWDTARQCFHRMGMKMMAECIASETVDFSIDAVYQCDTDKVVYSVIMTDRLSDYDAQNPFGPMKGQDMKPILLRYFRNAEAKILCGKDAPNEILYFALVQGVGRYHTIGWNWPESITGGELLQLSVAELETISCLETEDPLALWKFGTRSSHLTDRIKTISFSQLNMYGLYRHSRHGFYISDDKKPEILAISLGYDASVQSEANHKWDRHGVPSYSRGKRCEVIAHYGTPEVPIYRPLNPSRDQAAILLGGLRIPIWIVSPAKDKWHKLSESGRRLYLNFLEAIAYWLWRCTPSLSPYLMDISIANYDVLTIGIELEHLHLWSNSTGTNTSKTPKSITSSINYKQGEIGVILKPQFRDSLLELTNAGERQLMDHILRDIISLLAASDRNGRPQPPVHTMICQHIPHGISKMLCLVEMSRAPEMDSSGISRWRSVQEADTEIFCDVIGRHLQFTKKLAIGPIGDTKESMCSTLNEIVSFLLAEMDILLSSVSSSRMLEFLIGMHEALVAERSQMQLRHAPILKCFRDIDDVIAETEKRISDLDHASLVSRFVIEYAAASSPRGLRPISMDIYDRLQAIGSLVINYGWMSDLIHYDLAHLRLQILPSRRLGVNQEEYRIAQQAYVSVLKDSKLDRAIESFETYWAGPRSDKIANAAPIIQNLDELLPKDWPCSFTEVAQFIGSIIKVGEWETDCNRIYENDLIKHLCSDLSWNMNKVQATIERLAFSPRKSFWPPPAPFRGSDVQPWVFNRRLSYLQKPLLRRANKDTMEILWGPRHLLNAARYFFNLCCDGNLQTDNPELGTLMGRIKKGKGKALEKRVIDVYSGTNNWKAFSMKKIRGVPIKSAFPGQIDAVAVHKTKRLIHVVECKDIKRARTPRELSTELDTLYAEDTHSKSAIKQIKRKAAWIKENSESVLKYHGIPINGLWKIYPRIVTGEELMGPFLRSKEIPVLSVYQLERELKEKNR